MSQQFIDVHSFDGQLPKDYTPQHKLEESDKKIFLENFKNNLPNENLPVKQTLDLIIKDMTNPLNENMDTLNGNIDASDILIDVINLINEDNIDLLFEQLEDTMQLGTCAQGRVIRLYQLYKAFIIN